MNIDTQISHADTEKLMHSIIQRIATGPEMSKDISFEEARAGISAVLKGDISPVRAAIFLIALRMKRETAEENCGVLQGIIDVAGSATAEVDEVLDISDPYDGWNRGLPVAPFLPAVMAACGVPSLSHGLKSVGPKYGATHHMVLQAAGKKVDASREAAAGQLADNRTGWAYLDQSSYCPVLYDLVPFRASVIKRTVLTTVEVLVGPVRGRKSTHVMTGYVHKAYPALYASLARQAGFDSAMIVRGVEGGVIPSLAQKAKYFYYHDGGEEQEILLDPATMGISSDYRCVPLPAHIEKTTKKNGGAASPEIVEEIATYAAQAGQEALSGSAGPAFDSLVYGAAIALAHLGRAQSLAEGADMARDVLRSGAAKACFDHAP